MTRDVALKVAGRYLAQETLNEYMESTVKYSEVDALVTDAEWNKVVDFGQDAIDAGVSFKEYVEAKKVLEETREER